MVVLGNKPVTSKKRVRETGLFFAYKLL